MFKRMTKTMVISKDQMDLFTTILQMTGGSKRQHYILGVTDLETLSGEETIECKFYGVPEEHYNRLLTKLNKYGVKVA